MLDGRGDVRRVWTAAGGEAVGGQDDLTGGVDELQFQGFLLVEVVDVVVGHLQIHLLRRGVVGEEVADRSGLGLHGGADAVVVVVAYKGGKRGHRQQQHEEHHADAVDHPAPADALIHPLLHRQPILSQRPPRDAGQVRIKTPICSHSPKRW